MIARVVRVCSSMRFSGTRTVGRNEVGESGRERKREGARESERETEREREREREKKTNKRSPNHSGGW